jgi:hypothetical protein
VVHSGFAPGSVFGRRKGNRPAQAAHGYWCDVAQTKGVTPKKAVAQLGVNPRS